MNVDQFYPDIHKVNFYLGVVSQVYRRKVLAQVENLSLLSERKINEEDLVPNTINYYVVIEDVQGIFFGEVYQAKVPDTAPVSEAIAQGKADKVFPEIAIDIIGRMDSTGHFQLPGFKTVGIDDKVYMADKELINRFLESLEINRYDTKPKENHPRRKISGFARIAQNNAFEFAVQPNTLLDRHLLVVGATNSGKSTSALSLLSQLVNTGRKILIIDPTGEYRDAFDSDSDHVRKLILGEDTFLPVGEIAISQWEMLFQTNENTQGAVLAAAIRSLQFQMKQGKRAESYIKDGKTALEVNADMASLKIADRDFNLEMLPEQIDKESVKMGTGSKKSFVYDTWTANTNNWLIQKILHEFQYSSLTDFFGKSSADGIHLLEAIDEFCACSEGSLYIDASSIGTTDGIGATIIDLICNHVIAMDKSQLHPFVLFIDEVHRYTKFPDKSVAGLSGLVTIAREGRKKGIFLCLTTQSPTDVPRILLSQIGTLLIHRLTSYDDLHMINGFLDQKNQDRVSRLNQGEAILTSINLLQDLQLKFIKSGRTHDNGTPVL